MSNGTPVLFSLVGYPPQEVPGGIPATNDAGGSMPVEANYTIPPALWMFVFLVVGYVGLRMLMED